MFRPPLAATEGPFRLVVEGDPRSARSARMVARITVTLLGDGAAASSRTP